MGITRDVLGHYKIDGPQTESDILEAASIMSRNSKPAAKTTDRYDAFTVREYQVAGETRHDWTRIGVASPNGDGKGFRLALNALPLDGVILVRPYDPKEQPAE
ncbi:hypothetical protein ABQJ54_00595 [Rhodanobacter sp. Si-c]|uniref:Uncharacterized protein n=1 Tax=Rhodanobacter lycopersici TaxID=3162487 RepID=A0ABV3Q8Y0_9GAMM